MHPGGDPAGDILRAAVEDFAADAVEIQEGEDLHAGGQRIALAACEQAHRFANDGPAAILAEYLLEKAFSAAGTHINQFAGAGAV